MAWLRRDDFLQAGLDILAGKGSEGLTIASLCETLAISKGSFYHHFDGMADYVDALLQYWEVQINDRSIAISEDEPEPMTQIPVLTEIAVALPHATEAALRAWGESNPVVAAAQARVDSARTARILEVILSLGIEKNKGALLTDLAVSLLVGFQHQDPKDLGRLRAMLDEVNRLIYLEISS